ncbi:MAG: hypothetical protein JW902_10110 [Syntrophaceae bacterium]|nr:hypothetical protein [Syntrophaceae bacterium]
MKTPLKKGKGDGYLLKLISETILNKSEDSGVGLITPRKCVRSMNSIGC